jgi:HAD superfamily hydrolase (TIGR01548 family)
MKKNNYDAIIFDMDGVLINEGRSYRLAIEMTVNYLLIRYKFETRVDRDGINLLKSIPRFNNDWDVSYVLFDLLEKNVSRDNFLNKVKIVTGRVRKTKKYQEIKDIFQSFYLGEEVFNQIYNRKPPVTFQKGLINNDSLLLDLNILRSLAQKYKLGIATSRPRYEALFASKTLKITPDFIREEFIVAKEDVLREKPEPDPLLEVKKRMEVKNPIYVGDTINDAIAAKKARMPCIFIGDKKLGDFQFSNINRIAEVLL